MNIFRISFPLTFEPGRISFKKIRNGKVKREDGLSWVYHAEVVHFEVGNDNITRNSVIIGVSPFPKSNPENTII